MLSASTGAQLVEPLCALVRIGSEQGVQREHIAGIVMAEVALPRQRGRAAMGRG